MSEKDQKKGRVEAIIADLESRNERRVIGALKRVPHEGTADMVVAMFNLYEQNPSRDALMLLEKTLHNLKDPACIAPMVNLLDDSSKESLHQKVLSAIWLSGLEMKGHLELLTKTAINGSYMTAVEVLTIVENQDFEEDQAITNSIKLMDNEVEKKSDKQALMITLRQVLLDKLLG